MNFSPGKLIPPLLLFALGMLTAQWLFPEPKTQQEAAPTQPEQP